MASKARGQVEKMDSIWVSGTVGVRKPMSILRQSLPLQIVPVDDNPEGLKFPGVLEALEEQHIKVKMDADFLSAPRSEIVRVEFTMANFKFHFDSHIDARRDGNFIRVTKPTKIYKSTIRKGQRLRLNTQIGYNVWTEPGCTTRF